MVWDFQEIPKTNFKLVAGVRAPQEFERRSRPEKAWLGCPRERFFGHNFRDDPRTCLIFSRHINIINTYTISKN